MRKLLYAFIISALYTFSASSAWADYPNCTDTLRVTVSDLKDETFISNDGQYIVNINNAWQPLNTVVVSEDGFCFIKIADKRNKKYFSTKDSSNDSELSCVLKCPKCRRMQSCLLVMQNRWKCAQCGENLRPYYHK